MQDRVTKLFDRATLIADETTAWYEGTLPLRVRSYLTNTLPPLDLVTSVRAVVLRGDQVLVVRDPDMTHVLPGGKREAGETIEQTLRREVGEETGWTISAPRLIGVAQFTHLAPQPPDDACPYPDFLHLIYTATADTFDPMAKEMDGYELDAAFHPIAGIHAFPIGEAQRVFLEAAQRLLAHLLKAEIA
jgi:8-oxo-dGTP pyrophosphatase MutT (NUDIX family)